MLRVTPQQGTSFQQAEIQQFHWDIVCFFEKEEPVLFKTLSDAQKLGFVASCHSRAQRYGLELAASIYAWVDVSILVGSSFDQDIFFNELTTEIKKAAIAFDERDCMERAQKWLSTYLASARGEKNQFAIRALKRIRSFHALHKQPGVVMTGQVQSLEEFVTDLCAQIYPELHAYHGAPTVREKCAGLIKHSQSYYGITGEWHLVSMCMLGLSFGVGFDFDELYPWIQRTLGKVEQLGPERSVEKLVSRSMIWLDHVLKNTEQT